MPLTYPYCFATHFYVMSAADSAHHGSACIATTEHMPAQTLTEVEIRRTDGSLHTYCYANNLTYHSNSRPSLITKHRYFMVRKHDYTVGPTMSFNKNTYKALRSRSLCPDSDFIHK